LDGALVGAGVTQAVKKRKSGTTILTTFLSFPNQSLQNTILALRLFLFCTESKLVAIYFSFHSRCIVSVLFLLNVFLRSTFWSFFTWVSFLHSVSLLAHLWPINLMMSMNSIFRVG
jgi:hypothetical protein